MNRFTSLPFMFRVVAVVELLYALTGLFTPPSMVFSDRRPGSRTETRRGCRGAGAGEEHQGDAADAEGPRHVI